MRRALCCTCAWLGMSIIAAGCGDSRLMTYTGGHSNVTEPMASSKWWGRSGQTLIKERVPGGFFSISAEEYKYLDQSYTRLSDRFEEEVSKRLNSGDSGPLISPSGGGVISIEVVHACAGSYEYALAYGLLQDSRDSVTANGPGGSIGFKKVTIPAKLNAGGVLVYALLSQGPTEIVVKTRRGQIISSERWRGRGGIRCHVRRYHR